MMVVKYRFRLYLFALAILVGFGLVVYRLSYLQIDRHAEFVGKVPGQKELKIRVPGVRGEIKDRNGFTLVSNKPSFEVRVVMKEVMDEYRRLIREGDDKNAKVPKFQYTIPIQGINREREEDDYVAVFKQLVESKLNEMGLARPFDSNELRVHTRGFRGLVPWVYRDDLTFEEFARFAEHNLGLPGLSVGVRPSRQYIYGSLACHVLGYVRLPDDTRATEEERKPWGNYYVPDDYGVAGVEKTLDQYLVGKPGVRTVLVNQKGAIVGEIGYEEPRKGSDVHLTIDARIQVIAEKALRDANIGRGSVVVIEPNSGEVLAMASVPSYDPNRFIPTISEENWEVYQSNPVIPLLNRATSGYAPGSTYKIVTALAGCLSGITNSRWNCSGSVTYGRPMKCWIASKGGSHGGLDLSSAIKQSCNCFFYQYGNKAGLDNIEKVGQMMGLGSSSGIELDEEDSGSLVLPGHKWTRQNKPNENSRSPGFVANVSIGQGLVQASPLQMANVAATVANGGRAYPVHLLRRVVDVLQVVVENQPRPRVDFVAEKFVTQAQFELVRRGMWKVVNEDGGTAKGARMANVEVSGKTGTAQFLRSGKVDNHTWFIAFAPYDKPKFAICAFVQGGKSGGATAAPLVKRILEQALALEQGYQVAIETIPEVAGDFKPREMTTFANEIAFNLPESDDDADVGDASEARESRESTRKIAAPSIRKRADAAGSRGVDAKKEVPKAVPVRRAGFFQNLFKRDR
jgi:penicillin-binding protein 2